MTISIPSPDDLDDPASRGYVRDRISAANVALAWLKDARALMALHSLGDQYDAGALDDLMSDLRGRRDKMQEALDIAMQLRDARAPRRPTMDMLERIS